MQAQDEFYTQSPIVRAFIAAVRATQAHEAEPAALANLLKPAFAHLLATDGWLPARFRKPAAKSGMGGGIGTHLLYRAGDRSLSLVSLVVPPGASTPVHDHLAWGLIGLYQGTQREDTYSLVRGDLAHGTAELRLESTQDARRGDFYVLLPPDGDIHRITTTSTEPSISIHLLGNDVGCVVRHRFEPDRGAVTAFRSGYTNVPCEG